MAELLQICCTTIW